MSQKTSPYYPSCIKIKLAELRSFKLNWAIFYKDFIVLEHDSEKKNREQ